MSTHVMQIVGAASGRRGPVDGMYVVAYEPTQPPLASADCPPGSQSSEHCRLVLHPDPGYAMRGDKLTLMGMWRRSCPCGTPQPHGGQCRPLTAYTVSIIAVEEAAATALRRAVIDAIAVDEEHGALMEDSP